MTTIPTVKDLVERLKNIIGELTEFQYLYDELRVQKDPNMALSSLTEILGGIL